MKFGGWIEWRVKNRSRCFACTFLLILPLNIHTYIYIYRHTHIKYRASKIHDDLTFGARSNTYTPQHTHAHTTFRQFRQFLDMYRYFLSLSSAYCSTYRYVLLLNLQTPPLLHAILHVRYSPPPRESISNTLLSARQVATMVRGIIIRRKISGIAESFD